VKPRRGVAVVVLVGLLLLGPAGTASAGIDPIDWINTAILQKIEHVLSVLMLYEAKLLNKAQIDVYNRYRNFFATEAVLYPIKASIATVQSIRADLTAIACGWKFSPRTEMLRQLQLQPLKLCRPAFQLVWGTSVAGPDRDFDELADYVGTLTVNELSTRAQSEDASFRRAFSDTFHLAKAGQFSPGEANRHEAVMLAMAGQVALANNQLQAQKVLVDQLDREMDRREERQRAWFSIYALHGLTQLGRGPREAHP